MAYKSITDLNVILKCLYSYKKHEFLFVSIISEYQNWIFLIIEWNCNLSIQIKCKHSPRGIIKHDNHYGLKSISLKENVKFKRISLTY